MAPTVWICDLPSSQGFGVASAEENWGVYLFGLTSDVSEYFCHILFISRERVLVLSTVQLSTHEYILFKVL